MFESILTLEDEVVLTVVDTGRARMARAYSLHNGTVLWEVPACGLMGSVKVMVGESVVTYVVVRECVDGGERRYYEVLSGAEVTEEVEGMEKSGVGWFEEGQGAGKLMKDGSLRWKNFNNDAGEKVELYSHWDARFAVEEVVRHEGVAHAVDSTFAAAGEDDVLDAVVLLSEFATLFAYDLKGQRLWTHDLAGKRRGDKCAFAGGRHSVAVYCVNEADGDTRVSVISVKSGESVLDEKVQAFRAVHGYEHERCCSKNGACVVLVGESGERRIVSTCDKGYVEKSGLAIDDTMYISAKRGGATVEAYTGDPNPAWRFEFPTGLSIVDVAVKRAAHSLSRRTRLSRVRVTEDRKLLWKHTDAAAMLVLAKHQEGGKMTAAVINGNSGAVRKAMSHVNASEPYSAVASDNWFVYSFWNTYLLQQELHVIDMYEPKEESSFIVRKLIGVVRNNFPQLLSTVPWVEKSSVNGTCDASGTCEAEQQRTPEMLHTSFLVSHQVTILEHSETEGGITESSVLLGLANGQVLSLSRLAVDARRPKNGEYASAESLVPYYPYISFLPSESAAQFVTSNKYLAGLRGVRVAPVWRTESSCHVVAYGVDLYYRMLQPAGGFDTLPNDFRFATVLGSILAILAATLYSAHAVESKILHDAWYNL